MKFPLEEDGFQDDVRERQEALETLLPRIAKRQANAVSKELRERPWIGTILSAGESGVFISGGRDVGILPGQVFTVYPNAAPIPERVDSLPLVSAQPAPELSVVTPRQTSFSNHFSWK